MYKPLHGIVRKAKYSGIGEKPPGPHDLISRHAGNEEQRTKAWQIHIEALLSEAIQHEADAIKKYDHLLSELKIIPADLATRARLSETISHIREQEINRIGLLKRLRGY